MNYLENVRVGLDAVKSNKLRTTLTALIISIGIMALVGILTSIEGIEKSINDSFASIGANSFTIRNQGINIQIGRSGTRPKRFAPIKFDQAIAFKEQYNHPGIVSASVGITGSGIIKNELDQTNPNITVIGTDENHPITSGYTIALGRNFSLNELEAASPVTIIGDEVRAKLFPNNTDPINKIISIGSQKFRVIGVFAPKGSTPGGPGDKICTVPIFKAKQLITNPNSSYAITVMVNSMQEMESATGEAIGIFRNIRGVETIKENNFEIVKSDAVAATLISSLSYVTIAATVIGIITLIGASIGLMNIMLVSVTERTREIGIRKSLGATPTVIRRQFLVEAIIICQLGGLGGVFLGFLIGNALSSLLGGGLVFPWIWMLGGLVLCMIVGLISGIYPAIKASKLDPVEALRYE